MRYTRVPATDFQSYEVIIRVESAEEEKIFRSLLRRMKGEVSPNGIYDGIIDSIIRLISRE